ncbi:MAG TPA: hypothetical protein VIN08_11305 [Ohtaekwangia sp.]|uniref:hypothetical protein n=1 Tax=Ohtaekwangia sp. TaxID=2066019 RepID=UPI002F91EC44
MKKKSAAEVVIYTKTTIPGETTNTLRKEVKLKFNPRGFVIAEYEYKNEKPYALHEFERNGSSKIVKETFSYLDSTEQISTKLASPEITDYYYDLKTRLIKIKKRNEKGMVMPDIMADFSKYEYDKNNRVVKETVQYYYGKSSSDTLSHITIYTYNDNKLAGQSQTSEHNRVFLTTKSQYDKRWKPLQQTGYSGNSKTVAFQKLYEYDSQGRLIRHETKSNSITTECPGNATYTNIYNYSSEGLLLSITHTSGNKTCEMIFEYLPLTAPAQPSSGL